MSAIRSKDTSIELTIRRELHKAGFRYKLHNKDLPGKPDLVFPKYNAVVFIHGCFWHGHDEECKISRIPKSNTQYWIDKILKNKERDIKNTNVLLTEGWRILTIWECAIKGSQKLPLPILIADIEDWLTGDDSYSDLRGLCM